MIPSHEGNHAKKNIESNNHKDYSLYIEKKSSFLYYFFSPIAHRNSVELITTDGKKYQIMNSVLFGSRNSLKPNSKVTDERTTKIYNEVKNMISK